MGNQEGLRNAYKGKAEKGIIPAKRSNKLGTNVNACSNHERVENEEKGHRSDQTALVGTHFGRGWCDRRDVGGENESFEYSGKKRKGKTS